MVSYAKRGNSYGFFNPLRCPMSSSRSGCTVLSPDVAVSAHLPSIRFGLVVLALTAAMLALAGSKAAAQTPTATESVLYSFCGGGAQCPYNVYPSSLLQANDGNYYGIANTGGTYANGSVFMMTPSGTVSTIYAFCNGGTGACPDGSFPNALILGSDGNLYGVTDSGGSSSSSSYYGNGTVFKLTPSGTLTTLYNFCSTGDATCPDGAEPLTLIQGRDGNFYGLTYWNSNTNTTAAGTFFEITPSGTFSVLYTFCSTSSCAGYSPFSLIQGRDGNFYGTTLTGTPLTYQFGTIFELTPPSGSGSSYTLTTLYAFCTDQVRPCLDGEVPSTLLQGSDGNFYGLTSYGGTGTNATSGSSPATSGGGTAFELAPPSGGSGSYTLTTLYNFCSLANCADGELADNVQAQALVQGSDGNLYGIANGNSYRFSNPGVAFSLTPAGTYTSLYSFCGGASGPCTDGFYPTALIQGSDGSFYGTTESGGVNQDGALFKLETSPALAAPIQLSFPASHIVLGQSTTLSWKVLNGSNTSPQCYAFVQAQGDAAGAWTGLQTGTFSNGVYSGSAALTPSALGSYTYALTCGGTESGFATLTVAPPPLSITTTALPGASVGIAYSQTLAATGGVAPYAWSLASGSSLPAGLSLNASTGAITGTPTASGTSSFTVQVSDAETPAAVATQALSIVVVTPSFTLAANPSALTIAAGQSGTTTITLTPSGGYTGTLSLSCSGLPQFATCTFAPASLSVTGASPVTTTLTIDTDVATAALRPGERPAQPHSSLAYAAVSFAGLVFLFGLRRRRAAARRFGSALFLFLLAAVSGSALFLSGCGGSSKKDVTPAGSATVAVSAGTGAGAQTLNLTVTITQ